MTEAIFKYQGAAFKESQVFDEANRIIRGAQQRAVNTLNYIRENGSRWYPSPLTPEDESKIYIERFVDCLAVGDTTLLFKAALAYRAAQAGMELDVLKYKMASRSYSEWMRWG